MNDSRRRQTTPRASLLLAPTLLLASCGSNGGGAATAEAKASAPQGAAGAGAAEAVDRVAAAEKEVPVVTDTSNEEQAYLHEKATTRYPFFCTRDPAAFDLSMLTPAGGTSNGFANAWSVAKNRSELPGFMVAYSGTVVGPTITAHVGAVKRLGNGLFTFYKTRLYGPAPIQMGIETGDPYHAVADLPGMFITAFGKERDREGFAISHITIDGHLDSQCQSLRQVRVTMILPGKENAKQHFGDFVLGDAMGPLTEDTDGDGRPDSWSVTMVADRLQNQGFTL